MTNWDALKERARGYAVRAEKGIDRGVERVKDYAQQTQEALDEGVYLLRQFGRDYGGRHGGLVVKSVGKSALEKIADVALTFSSRKEIATGARGGEFAIECLAREYNGKYPTTTTETVPFDLSQYQDTKGFGAFGKYAGIVKRAKVEVFGEGKIQREEGDSKKFGEKMDQVVEKIVSYYNNMNAHL